MRQTAVQNMCIGMEIKGFTLEDVKNKIKSIRSTYERSRYRYCSKNTFRGVLE